MVLVAEEEILSLEKTTFTVGEAINVRAIGDGTDWIGIYYPGEPHSIRWKYVTDFGSGNAYDITKGVDNGGAPDVLPAGEYVIRLMPNDSTNTAEALAEISITIVESLDDLPQTPVSATYTLDNATDGFAKGKISVTLAEGNPAADIICYWADENGALDDYTPLAKFKVEAGSAVSELSENLYIPTGAKALWVYTATKSGTLCDTPYVITLPEGAAHTPREGLLMEFQVVSDLHIRADASHIHDRHFLKMLNDVAMTSPDSKGIFVVGDMTDSGLAKEYEAMISMHGNAIGVPKLYLTLGNHDLYGGTLNEKIAQFLEYATLPDGSNPESCHYDFTLDGYHFIFLGNDRLMNGVQTTLSKETTEWLDQTIAEGYEEGKPVFLFLHQSLYDTVAGSLEGQGWNGVANEAPLRAVLQKYPDVILFNGHSHWILDSYRTMYTRSDTLPSIFNTSSVGYLWTSYNITEGEAQIGSEGYYVRVYKDCVEVLGRDFANGKWVSSAQFAVPYSPKSEEPPITEAPDTTDTPVTDTPITDTPVIDTPVTDVSNGDASGSLGLWIALGAVAVVAVAGTLFFVKKKKKK